MKRPDWRASLSLYLASVSHRALRPGTWDCIIFAAGARAAQTGVDLMTPWIGRYSTYEEGFELLRAQGFADHVAAVTQGLDAVPVAMAQVGDLVVLDGAEGLDALGVVGGAHVYVVGPRSAQLVPLTAARQGWRV